MGFLGLTRDLSFYPVPEVSLLCDDHVLFLPPVLGLAAEDSIHSGSKALETPVSMLLSPTHTRCLTSSANRSKIASH